MFLNREKHAVYVASLISNYEVKLSLNFLIIRYLNMTVTSCFLAVLGAKFDPLAFLAVQFIFHLLWLSLSESKPHNVQYLISKLLHLTAKLSS